jgi:circadian clock protein KaiB
MMLVFEAEAMSERPTASPLVLRLYIAGETPNSMLAVTNLRTALGNRAYDLEVVDVLTAPERALDDDVFVTPTLVRVSPEPRRTIVGSLSQSTEVIARLWS